MLRVVGGYLFPAGANFVVNSYALNQRNSFWGKDGQRYSPEHLISDCGTADGGRSTRARYNYWRFGFGPRQCMGKYVADLVIRELLIHPAENFTLSHMKSGDRNEEERTRDPETWINHPLMELKCTKRKRGPWEPLMLLEKGRHCRKVYQRVTEVFISPCRSGIRTAASINLLELWQSNGRLLVRQGLRWVSVTHQVVS